MPYLTTANSLQIIARLDINSIGENIGGFVYKKPIYFFSRRDEKKLLIIQELLRNPAGIIEVYMPIHTFDTFSYVFEGNKPSFHHYIDCPRLKSDYKNFKIPVELKERYKEIGGDEAVFKFVSVFREWFRKHQHLIDTDIEQFIMFFHIKWGIILQPEEIKRPNSGIEAKENYELPDLEKKIDEILSIAGKFYRDNPDKQTIIKRFAKFAFIGYSKRPIEKNDTELSDDELKEFLKYYDITFKKPIQELLIEYYRVKYNPEMRFEGKLLEQLNFQQCKTCEAKLEKELLYPVKTNNIGDEVPFPTEEPPYLDSMFFDNNIF